MLNQFHFKWKGRKFITLNKLHSVISVVVSNSGLCKKRN